MPKSANHCVRKLLRQEDNPQQEKRQGVSSQEAETGCLHLGKESSLCCGVSSWPEPLLTFDLWVTWGRDPGGVPRRRISGWDNPFCLLSHPLAPSPKLVPLFPARLAKTESWWERQRSEDTPGWAQPPLRLTLGYSCFLSWSP